MNIIKIKILRSMNLIKIKNRPRHVVKDVLLCLCDAAVLCRSSRRRPIPVSEVASTLNDAVHPNFCRTIVFFPIVLLSCNSSIHYPPMFIQCPALIAASYTAGLVPRPVPISVATETGSGLGTRLLHCNMISVKTNLVTQEFLTVVKHIYTTSLEV